MIEEEIRTQFKIERVTKSLRGLYAIVWLEIAVLAVIIIMQAWLLLYAMDSLKSIADDNARVVEIVTEGGRA